MPLYMILMALSSIIIIIQVQAMALQLLVVQLALQLLRLSHLPYCLVEVVLVDRVSVVFDGEETTVVG